MLHQKGNNSNSRPEERQINKNQNESSEDTSNVHQDSEANRYYQIVPVTLRNGERKMDTHAFLDAGSSITLIDEGAANELNLEGRPEPLKLKWTQNVTKEETFSRRITLKFNGVERKQYTLQDVRTIKNLQLPMQTKL